MPACACGAGCTDGKCTRQELGEPAYGEFHVIPAIPPQVAALRGEKLAMIQRSDGLILNEPNSGVPEVMSAESAERLITFLYWRGNE